MQRALKQRQCWLMISTVAWTALLSWQAVGATNPLVPDYGAWVGVSIDWQEWASVNDYVQQAEIQPTSYTIFVR